MMMQLWSDRKMWISAYYKNIFCARMTSTQRSESMNHVLKKRFVKGTQNLHKFARRVNACIQTRMQKENEQTMTSMVWRQKKLSYCVFLQHVHFEFKKNETHDSASTKILIFDMCRPILWQKLLTATRKTCLSSTREPCTPRWGIGWEKPRYFAQSVQQSPLSTLCTTTTSLSMMMKKDFPG